MGTDYVLLDGAKESFKLLGMAYNSARWENGAFFFENVLSVT